MASSTFKNNKPFKIFNIIIYLFLFFILGFIIIFIYQYYQYYQQNRVYSFKNKEFKEYYAQSPYADVKCKANDFVMYVSVKYKKLNGVSAMHIHVNNNGSPGPVLAWLGTTIEWQRGVAQTDTNGNSPCCTKNNEKCSLASPNKIGTPYLNKIVEFSEKTFVFHNENKNPSKCPWIQNGFLLDIHGFNFQQNINGELTSGKPGADIIFQKEFEEIKE